jgi:hypothetical protein
VEPSPEPGSKPLSGAELPQAMTTATAAPEIDAAARIWRAFTFQA